MAKTILVIDDDLKLNRLLQEYLSQHHFQVVAATHPDEGLSLLRRRKPDLVILDVMLPDQDGFEVCKQIRKESVVPIIMLTARGDVMDRVVGLELGADDYLGKPFEPRELLARIQSVLRRANPQETAEVLAAGKLTIDLAKHAANLGGAELELTAMEYEILALFMKNPGRVLDRDTLLESMRGLEWEAYDRSMDVLISRLRQKLGDDPKHPEYIKTIRGTGYMFIPKDDREEAVPAKTKRSASAGKPRKKNNLPHAGHSR
jgi:two-component system phosphate regulon response regulator OmpR